MTAARVDHPSVCSLPRVDPARSSGSSLWRTAVLAAIVVGLALGAMTCAAGLADGNGHAMHSATEPAGHDSHPTERGSREHGSQVMQRSSSAAGDASPTTLAEAHPGMACLIPVDLRFDGPTVATSSDLCMPLGPVALASGSGELDPPVPRPS